MMTRKIDRLNVRLWRLMLSIPFVKPFLLITNSYVWFGDPLAFTRFAPVSLYFKRLFARIFALAAISWGVVYFGRMFGLVKTTELGTIDIVLQLFPNVLGFGIGAYALLFTFPDRFFENLEKAKHDQNQRVGAQGLNAVMAFPLLMIVGIIMAALVVKISTLPQSAFDTIGLFLNLYGLLLSSQVVSNLYTSARKIIRNVVTR